MFYIPCRKHPRFYTTQHSQGSKLTYRSLTLNNFYSVSPHFFLLSLLQKHSHMNLNALYAAENKVNITHFVDQCTQRLFIAILFSIHKELLKKRAQDTKCSFPTQTNIISFYLFFFHMHRCIYIYIGKKLNFFLFLE